MTTLTETIRPVLPCAGRDLSIAERVSMLTPAEREAWLLALPVDVLEEVWRGEWWYTSRPKQRAPEGDWTIWLLLAGRGFGKGRAVTEWLIEQAIAYPRDVNGHPTEWAVVGETLADTRAILLDGPSGLVAALNRRGILHKRINWPKPQITLATGQIIHGLGADDTDVGRGLNLAGAVLDEIAKWRDADILWREGLFPALRTRVPGGHKPRVAAATTPKATKLVKDWATRADGSVHLTRGSTWENAANLAPEALAEFRRQYDGTRAGRQELEGELLIDAEGALWKSALIDSLRINVAPDWIQPPEFTKVMVAMDPATTATEDSDETGLVCVARGVDGHDYVLADGSGRMTGSPAARAAWLMWRDFGANSLGYEPNNGGDFIKSTLEAEWEAMQAEEDENGEPMLPAGAAPLVPVRAYQGKRLRADPVAARYGRQMVHHVGYFAEMEGQQTTWEGDSTDSPDRLDALVHAITMLGGTRTREVEIHRPTAVVQRPGRESGRTGLRIVVVPKEPKGMAVAS